MSQKSPFLLRERNPDVLTSIANLSNDEVFTPPSFANQMLDTVAKAWSDSNNGANIWSDKNVKFLDPFTKSGVFLREIVRRLSEGLEKEIPDIQERINHIVSKQVFGIAITQLTALTTRRSVYCSKRANGKHSIATIFKDEEGSIWFKRKEHTWVDGTDPLLTVNEAGEEIIKTSNGKCKYCKAPQKIFDRDDAAETYAYSFIHTESVNHLIENMFGEKMQFDVVIGNPPYQMAGGAGGTSDSSIYHLFVEQAMRLEPKLICMVIPSRWIAGGRGMGSFRKEMLSGGKLRYLIDFPVSKDVFPGVEVKGGVCYFAWDRDYKGLTEFTSIRGEETASPSMRKLDEFDILIRSEIGSNILKKVIASKPTSITQILSPDTPFGISTNSRDFKAFPFDGSAELHYVEKGKRLTGYVSRKSINKNADLIDSWKVLIPEAGSDGGQRIPDPVLGKPLIVGPNSVCSQTYLCFSVGSKDEAECLVSYIESKFFRFLVSLRKITQHALRSTYTWVPIQKLNKQWTDEELFKIYALSKPEQEYVERVIKSVSQDDD